MRPSSNRAAPRWAGLALVLLAVSAVRAQTAAEKAPESHALRIGAADLLYTVWRPSLPGRFFFTLTPDMKSYGGSPSTGTTASLAALDADGEIAFQRSTETHADSKGGSVPVMMGFWPAAPGSYAYLVAQRFGLPCFPAELHFLDADFRDAAPEPGRASSPRFDAHFVLSGKDKHVFYLVCRDNIPEGRLDYEIQERDGKGDVVFSWSTQGLTPAPPVDLTQAPDYDPWHMNGLSFASNGDLLASFGGTSEVRKIAYPSGKVLWQLSQRSWTFLNDPLGGFIYQHSVQELPNGDLLLFDDGGYKRGPRAVEYRLDEKRKTATLVWEYRTPVADPDFWVSAGSAARLSNGNTLIDWGIPQRSRGAVPRRPIFSEVDPAGRLVRELDSLNGYGSFHTYFEESPGPRRP
jgi:hypothetical protein